MIDTPNSTNTTTPNATISEFSRTELLIGEDNLSRLADARVAVFGVGGVGGYVVEALVRSGVEHIDVIDNDTVSITNINRQIIALHSTIGKNKVDVIRERALDINPKVVMNAYNLFFTPETSDQFNFEDYDYIVDAIDSVTGKIELVVKASKCGTKIISSMGAGNKLNPTLFQVSDISKTSVCPLARVIRRELKNRAINHLKVVYSTEPPLTPAPSKESSTKPITKRQIPGSVSFVPSVVGLIIAGEVIKDLCENMEAQK